MGGPRPVSCSAVTESRPAPALATASAPRAAAPTARLSLGWRRVADELLRAVPAAEIERAWLFPPVRNEDREWGTAVLARRVCDGRLRIYTGSYYLVVRGRERGQGHVAVEDVGETPDAVVGDVIRGVQERAGEAQPPIEIAPAAWLEDRDEPPAAR
jgi:hypothetical protein